MKRCSVCKEVKELSEFSTRPDRPSGYRSECKRCQYDRQYRREKYKIRAKDNARVACKKGLIQKPLFCEVCGENKPLDRHHPNYDEQLKIMWVCRKCHTRLHSPVKIA